MTIKPEQLDPEQPVAEDVQYKRIEEACERLARSVAEQRDESRRKAPMKRMATLRTTAGYTAIAFSVFVVGPVAAQETEDTERGVVTATRAGVRAAQEERRAANAERREGRLADEADEERDERLLERADEREDAREARIEERANVDEDAAARSQRRATARSARWESIRDQSGLRNPDELSAVALAELRTHARREARLRSIRNRAVDAGDTETTERVDATLEREARRHDVALSTMMAATRATPRRGMQMMRPAGEGAQ